MSILNLLLGFMELFVMTGMVYYFMSGLERKIYRSRWCYVCAFLVYGAGIILLPAVLRNDIITMLVLAGFVIVMEYFLFNREKSCLLYCGIYQIMVLAGQIVVILICSQIYKNLGGSSPLFFGNCVISIKIVMELMLTFFIRAWIKRKKASKAEKGQLAAMLLLLAATIFLISAVMIVSDVYIQLKGTVLVVLMIFVLIMINVEFLYLFRYMFRTSELETEMKLMNQKTEINYQYYTDLEQKYQESRKIIHDMKNHLQAVEALCNASRSEEGQEYMQDIYHMLNVLGECYYSDVKMLNIILNEKIRRAQSKDIQVEAKIGETDLSHMRDIDLTAVFANLLDNAIEAASVSEEKWIHLKIDTIHEFVAVSLENSIPDSDVAGKEEKRGTHMGIGMKNVREVLERYHGTMKNTQEKDRYCVSLMIPKG